MNTLGGARDLKRESDGALQGVRYEKEEKGSLRFAEALV